MKRGFKRFGAIFLAFVMAFTFAIPNAKSLYVSAEGEFGFHGADAAADESVSQT